MGADGQRVRPLIWTRSVEDWGADQELFSAVPPEIAVVHVPCLRLVAAPVQLPAPWPRQQAAGASYNVIMTSAHAVDFAMGDPGLAAAVRGAGAVYTHGELTWARLQAHGIAAQLAGGVRTAAELGVWLGRVLPPGSAVLLPGAAALAYDLAGALRSAGFSAAAVVCYTTEAAAHLPNGDALTSAAASRLYGAWGGAALCFASPSAVRGFCAGFAEAMRAAPVVLHPIAIGPTTAAAVREAFGSVLTAENNSLQAVVAAACQVLTASG